MKIAVTSSGPEPSAMMDDRLGRCPYFFIFDTVTGKTESILNKAVDASSGAGTKAMQSLVDKGVDVIITGRIGPHASAMVAETNIEAVTGKSGKVQDVLDDFKRSRGL